MIASIFTRYKRGGVAEFQEFLFLKLLFIRYLLVKADSLVKPDHDPRTRCLYATHSTVCDGNHSLAIPKVLSSSRREYTSASLSNVRR